MSAAGGGGRPLTILLPVLHQGRRVAEVWLRHSDPGVCTPERRALLAVIAEDLGQVLDRIALTRRLEATEARLSATVQHLTRLQGLYRALAAVSDAVVRTPDEARLRRRTCRRLAGSGLFQAAWFGRPDPRSGVCRGGVWTTATRARPCIRSTSSSTTWPGTTP
ncbi:protein of unknown function [Candidatus Hydrogenisulfobacillus filiaventi]|uniref:GAF domain-containing protein n=1 Tax=Candidatus Hydrogenisulfobacillus filiaventi TaxID=2707344 RepID=A0A6F8ZDZ4_9FIRM|nr:protein of unknown function [Candidatus Hydrogenisulfobacillus filiaventi]